MESLKLIVLGLALAAMANAQSASLQRAIVIPSSEDDSNLLDQAGMSKLVQVLAKEPASAELDTMDSSEFEDNSDEVGSALNEESSIGSTSVSDDSDIGASDSYLQNNPQAIKMAQGIHALANLIKRAKKVSDAIPDREKKLTTMKDQLKKLIRQQAAYRARKRMAKYQSKIKLVDSKMRLFQNKLAELSSAKSKLEEVVGKWQKLAEVADSQSK